MSTTEATQDTAPMLFRAGCAVVGFVAGAAGVVMLIAPDPESTERYFSWGIKPAALAALVGSFYIVSAATFVLVAVRNRWSEARPLAFGVVGLCLPTLYATARDTDLFDFSRLQAIAWPLLFIAAPIVFGFFLYLERGEVGDDGPRLTPVARGCFAVLGLVYAVLAAMLVIDPGLLNPVVPFDLARLSGRFLGSWATFLAVLAIFAAVRNRARETWASGLALTLWPLAGLAAALRTSGQLQADGRVGYFVALLVLLVLGAVAWTTA